MGRIVACDHCGAPHRPARGQTRFTCEWCGGENADASSAAVEELAAVGTSDASRARRRAVDLLRRRGVRSARVEVGQARWLPIWQVVGAEGEEFVRCGRRRPDRLVAGLGLPPARLVGVDELGSDFADEDAGRPTPELEAAEIVAAARATFEESEAPLRALRLIWVHARELRIHTASSTVAGLHLGAPDEVLVGSLPAEATDPPARPGLVAAYAGFVAGAFGLGLLVEDPFGRALACAAWLVVGWSAWAARTLWRRSSA